ncbi:MAG: hypothetical protein M1305_07385 [Candidatus Marsarchaeota archaeon]|nr:hypothetical protein [Candidatus Marsarchaeota archaeon]
METEVLEQGVQRSVPGGATLTIENLNIGKGEGLSAAVLLMSFATSVSGSLLADWLVSKLKGKVPSIEIDETEVVVDKGEITKIINRKIRGSK